MGFNFEDKGFDDYNYWIHTDIRTVDKIIDLLKNIDRNGPLNGIGKPEKLKGRKGMYSRRIDKENRLVYKYSEGNTIILSCKGHYDNI